MRSDQLPSVNNSAAEDLRKNKIKCVSFLSVLFVLLVGVALLSLRAGSYNTPVAELIKGVFGRAENDKINIVVRNNRLPRICTALLAGAGLGTSGAVDCGAYVSTFLAAASSLGVATCAQAALALYSDGVREHLGIPEDRLIVCGIAFGHADTEHPANAFRTERAELADVVRRHD